MSIDALQRYTRDDTEHGQEYFLASDVLKAIADAEKQEPVAWAVMKDGECLSVRRFEPAATSHADGVQFVPLYTTPPQRKPLTDEEERKACEEWCYSVGLMQKSHGVISINSQVEAVWMAWKARAAHGIKENT